MDYLLMQRNIIVVNNIMQVRRKDWFRPKIYKPYAKDQISVLSLELLIVKVNLVSGNIYLRDYFFED